MIDRTCYVIDHPENNFLKIENIESELLWGNVYPIEGTSKSPKEMFLSVVIITYKRVDMVRQALRSVCEQKGVSYEWEILLMDNNPEEEELLPYVKKLDNPRIRYYRNKQNLEHEGNINRGVELAKGKWVAFLHDDDLLAPDYLVLIEQYIKACAGWRRPLAYIRTKHMVFSDEKQLPVFDNRKIENKLFVRPEPWAASLLRGHGPTFVNSCGCVVNRELFVEVGGYNDKLNPIGDATLGLIFMKKGYGIYATERVLGFYRQGENESLKKETLLGLIEADYYLREYLYKQNIFSGLFGRLFREIQYTESVDKKIARANQYHRNDKSAIPTMEEINAIHRYRKCGFWRMIQKIMSRGIEILYRPSRISGKRDIYEKDDNRACK